MTCVVASGPLERKWRLPEHGGSLRGVTWAGRPAGRLSGRTATAPAWLGRADAGAVADSLGTAAGDAAILADTSGAGTSSPSESARSAP